MTAKSPDDKHTNDPGASAAPTTLMSWLAKKFPNFFHTSPCPEDMSGFFDALELDEAKKVSETLEAMRRQFKGRFAVDQSHRFGKVVNVELRFGDKDGFYSVEGDKTGHHVLELVEYIVQGEKVIATGGMITMHHSHLLDTVKTERELLTWLRGIGAIPKPKDPYEDFSERLRDRKASDRKKAIRATAELLMVEVHANHMRNSSFGKLADRVAREAYDRAVEIHDALDRIEKIQAVIDDEPMDVKPTVPRPVGAE